MAGTQQAAETPTRRHRRHRNTTRGTVAPKEQNDAAQNVLCDSSALSGAVASLEESISTLQRAQVEMNRQNLRLWLAALHEQ